MHRTGRSELGPTTLSIRHAADRLSVEVTENAARADTERTVGVLARLRALGCDQARGFLVSRPLPPLDLEAWFATGGPAARVGAVAG